jgi:hypothetical protein
MEIKSSRTFSTNSIDGMKGLVRNSILKTNNCFVIYGDDEEFNFKDINIRSWRNIEIST